MPASTDASNPEKIVLRYRSRDTASGVTRDTAQRLAQALGLSETQLVHRALAEFARQLLPQYAQDDGPLTDDQLAAVRDLTPQDGYRPTESLIDGL